MDSLTQLVLGASVGEAVLGRKVGNRAVVWGAIGGTIPDLDVLLNPFLSDVQGVLIHRTFSHSLLVLTLLAPIIGYGVWRLHRSKTVASWKDWSWLFFFALVTHTLLDSFTNYGTMLFFPFSDVRVAWRTIFIIDPLYTLPMLIGTLAILFLSRNSPRRKQINRWALLLSSSYLVLTVIVKLHVQQVVRENLTEQSTYGKFLTSPTFFNSVLWSVIVKEKDQYQVGYYSLLDDDRTIQFKSIPRQAELLQPYLQSSEAKKELDGLINFTEGFYAVQPLNEGVQFSDLRFGITTGWFDLTKDYIFSYRVYKENDTVLIQQQDRAVQPTTSDLQRFFQRTLGTTP
ncbi:metal-dependent hydrolase [Tunicatimonas pelagia]|uniref:metal-dependent hydrolase n=1 Tax=Tunicatimonas pelagia TaxID=931531 RepID=UPI00266657D1|nr:metal-dependent hydrolase [Tunicatimonas pelagia]WKN45972.1 metal-dependent hydrolase [Tunicatimonas pelagia]